jgi:hypothetical protein
MTADLQSPRNRGQRKPDQLAGNRDKRRAGDVQRDQKQRKAGQRSKEFEATFVDSITADSN